MKNTVLAALLSLFALASCASLKPESFSSTPPNLDPVTFFGGHTHSTGVIESRSGEPSERITTQTAGVFANGILHMEQDLHSEDSKPTHRTFDLKIIDAHHVDATGSDVVGTAHGELYGNYFTWSFRLKIADKGLVQHVNMTQCMYLMPDGKTLIIRSIIRKFGIIVKEITEQFHKDN
ncbi:MAG: DUF3833 domain-containing protein [Bacteroidota bacterium]|nr:DUF3833 domain-containing protein [Bacteroidota bacterium]